MKLQTLDDILAHYGGEKEEKKDESELSADIPRASKDIEAERITGQDETCVSG